MKTSPKLDIRTNITWPWVHAIRTNTFRSDELEKERSKTPDKLEKRLSMEEKKLKTLQEEYRNLNQKYKKSEDALAEHKEARTKLEAKLKVVNDDIDRKIEEATGEFIT